MVFLLKSRNCFIDRGSCLYPDFFLVELPEPLRGSVKNVCAGKLVL